MAYLQKRAGMEKQALLKLLGTAFKKHPILMSLGTALGGAYLYGRGKSAKNAELEDWQKDPNIGMNRTYVDSTWNL